MDPTIVTLHIRILCERSELGLLILWFIAEWDSKQEDQTDVNVWEDNWDDDAIEDDFSVQLRSELENQGMKMES